MTGPKGLIWGIYHRHLQLEMETLTPVCFQSLRRCPRTCPRSSQKIPTHLEQPSHTGLSTADPCSRYFHWKKKTLPRISWRSTCTQKKPLQGILLLYWQLCLAYRGHFLKSPSPKKIHLHRETERKLLLDYLAIYDFRSKVLFFP